MSSLSGFISDESVYLNFNTGGLLDFTGLLLGAIIIGVLGVLDDIAVTQSAVVSELYNSNPALSAREVYRRALRVGREHVGALVNTLVLAYWKIPQN
ncbi:YibE/F family protein [Candidatus Kaiserbacteria bacterium]|nr:YibE/F family protein [Candidatus Kaiserbacteria bacterium]USN92593.1 MAG: YibE/F family protein [Candidatus Nomurabacteria bacterium]